MPVRATRTSPRFLRLTDRGFAGGYSSYAQNRLLKVADGAGFTLAHAHSFRLLHQGDVHFQTMLDAIASARREVCIEMYQIRPDPIGWRICTALAEAAMAGVSVRLLLDSFGSARVVGWLTALRSHGIEVRWYNPWRPWTSPFRRTHRKLVVIDGRVASIGGINFAAEFSESFAGDDAWRDVALWLEGSAAWQLHRQFLAAWRAHGGEPTAPLAVPTGSGSLCALSGGHTSRLDHGCGYVALAESARHELLLATPYFLPDRVLREAIIGAASRGVRVTVVVPRVSDLWWFKHGSRRRYYGLLESGIRIVERCDRMVHAKVGVMDGVIAAVGSANLNRLSFRSNAETLLLTTDPAVVRDIRAMLAEESITAGDPLSASHWARHPDRRRLAEWAASPMALIF
jgi:cardiolipin synthase